MPAHLDSIPGHSVHLSIMAGKRGASRLGVVKQVQSGFCPDLKGCVAAAVAAVDVVVPPLVAAASLVAVVVVVAVDVSCLPNVVATLVVVAAVVAGVVACCAVVVVVALVACYWLERIFPLLDSLAAV